MAEPPKDGSRNSNPISFQIVSSGDSGQRTQPKGCGKEGRKKRESRGGISSATPPIDGFLSVNVRKRSVKKQPPGRKSIRGAEKNAQAKRLQKLGRRVNCAQQKCSKPQKSLAGEAKTPPKFGKGPVAKGKARQN